MEVKTILKFLVAVTDSLVSLFFFMGLTIALSKINLKNKIIWWSSIAAGLIGSIIVFTIKVTKPKSSNIALIKFNRQLVVFIAIMLLLAFIWGIIQVLFKKKRAWMASVNTVLIGLVLAGGIIYIFPQVYQFTREFVYFGEETISTMSLLRFLGFFIGIVLSFVLALSLNKVYSALSEKERNIFTLASIFVFGISYLFSAVSSLARMRVLKSKGIVFEMMIIEDNYHKYFIYGLLLVGVVALSIAIAHNRHIKGEFKNNALRRKEKAKLRNRRRWSYSLFTSIFLAIFILSVVNYYDTKEVEPVAPQEYKVEGNKIIIDIKDVEDGHLHRFSYVTPNGYDVRFLAVKKPQGNAYGLGLDACEICGVAGYFERGEDVVCKRCDVVMNKATIGFKGGCNPIPFPYVVENGMIIIDKKDLEKEEQRFK